jgi:selenocysteine lyase/cysteine desulfurase
MSRLAFERTGQPGAQGGAEIVTLKGQADHGLEVGEPVAGVVAASCEEHAVHAPGEGKLAKGIGELDLPAETKVTIALALAGVEGEGLMMAIKDVAVSSGSACTSASLEPSYVLRALGVGEELAHSSIRFGLGRFTTDEEVDYVAELVVKKVQKLRELSPLYEMFKEGVDLKSVQWVAH